MVSFAHLSREERIGLGIAAAAHVALVAALVFQVRDDPTGLPIPERMTVSLADEVSLTSTAPDPSAEPQASIAPILSSEPEPVVEPVAAEISAETATVPVPEELGFVETAPELESLEMPLQLIEVDFDVNQLQAAPVNETQRVEELIRKDAPPPPAPRGWLGRSQWFGRRVAEFFGRS